LKFDATTHQPERGTYLTPARHAPVSHEVGGLVRLSRRVSRGGLRGSSSADAGEDAQPVRLLFLLRELVEVGQGDTGDLPTLADKDRGGE